jgi:uncharacterized SAM-binding protein YcdF (DUF218 family)
LPLTRTRGLLLALLVLVILLAVSLPAVARTLGAYLVDAQPPERADAILVLAGDMRCNRIVRAGELVRDGFAARALVSSPHALYGVPEGELAVNCAVMRGQSREWFEIVKIEGESTVEEANQFAPVLRGRGIRTLLIVTNESHTRRAGSVFRSRLGSDVTVRMIGVPDPYFRVDSWWKHHEGREIVFFEWTKTVVTALGL